MFLIELERKKYSMEKIAKEIVELAQFGELHSEDCCVNFPEDKRACDVGTGELDCCDNMRTLAKYAENLVQITIDFLSYDITFKDEAQRKEAVKMYYEDLKSKIKELSN